jgi:hypothetical protein
MAVGMEAMSEEAANQGGLLFLLDPSLAPPPQPNPTPSGWSSSELVDRNRGTNTGPFGVLAIIEVLPESTWRGWAGLPGRDR